MEISLDNWVLWQWGPVLLNATLVYTWLVMALLTGGSWLVTRRLCSGPSPVPLAESSGSLDCHHHRSRFNRSASSPPATISLLSARCLFLSLFSNLLSIIPGYHPPTDSLSTTAALALCVLVAVPLFGITQQGASGLPEPLP